MIRIFRRRPAALSLVRKLFCAAFVTLAGCAQPAAPWPQTAAAAPEDPVLRAVAAAAVRIPVSVTSLAYPAPVTLIVTADYISAEGQECRAYTLGGGQNLACMDGTSWRDIPPLAPAATTGPAR